MTDPRLAALLATRTPAGTTTVTWADGMMPLAVAAFPEPADLPDELVTSVRCITVVDDRVLVCTNADGSHPWPGGRREAGESHAETAVREVYEETGWHVDPASVRPLGWLHLRHLAPRRDGYLFPYPDFLQLVVCGSATGRAVAEDAPWQDLDHYELECRPLPLAEARKRGTELLAPLFFDAL